MNTLIDPLKRIARDLVDKKLWPVAALLLVALVAVPMLIGGSSEQAPSPVALAGPAAGAPASKSLVTVVDEAADDKDSRPGRAIDPIYDPPAPPSADTGSGSGAGDSAGGSAGTGGSAGGAAEQAPSSGGGASPAREAPAQTTPPVRDVATSVYYRTEVRWYEHKPAKSRPITRLTPFGGLADPAAIYLGVTKSSSSYAVFLLGPNATSDGEAECEDDTDCRVIGLKAGQTQIVTVQPADGGEARRYVLDVVAVRTIAADAPTARKMRLRVHADGRDVLRAMWQHEATADALGPIQFDRDSGLLVKSAKAGGDAAGADQPAG